MFSRRTVSSLIAVGAVAVAGLSASAPAQAAGSLKLCANDGYKGKCQTRVSYDASFANDFYCSRTLATVGGPNDCGLSKGIALRFEDKTSSVANGTTRWWKLYEDRGYKGYVLCLRPRGYDADLGNNTSQEDDISSVRIQGTRQPGGCDKVIG